MHLYCYPKLSLPLTCITKWDILFITKEVITNVD